jgi:hypothetical protein
LLYPGQVNRHFYNIANLTNKKTRCQSFNSEARQGDSMNRRLRALILGVRCVGRERIGGVFTKTTPKRDWSFWFRTTTTIRYGATTRTNSSRWPQTQDKYTTCCFPTIVSEQRSSFRHPLTISWLGPHKFNVTRP